MRWVRVWAIVIIGMLAACEKDPANTSHSLEDTESQSFPVENGLDVCANLDLTLERQPTTIMLVIDHSASMDLPLGDNDTRWSVVVEALMGTVANPQAGLVWSLEERVNFGLVLFTAKRNEPSTCPMLQSMPPALHNGGAIASIFQADDETYKGASPVPEGMVAATTLLEEMAGLNRKVIVLATDGAPQTCGTLAELDDPVGREQTVRAVQAAYEAGIATFVIGLGDEDTTDHLQEVANAGIGLPPAGTESAPFHMGLTENSLMAAISDVITTESRSCVYELDGVGIDDGADDQGTVVLDGEALSLGDEEFGWRLRSPGEFELLGEACEDIQIGEHHLEADFPCEAIIEIE